MRGWVAGKAKADQQSVKEDEHVAGSCELEPKWLRDMFAVSGRLQEGPYKAFKGLIRLFKGLIRLLKAL